MKIECDPTIKITNQYVRNTEKNLKESKKQISTHYGYGRCNSENDEAFEVSIGPDNIQRTLIILQTLCNALNNRGYSIGLKPKKANTTPQYQYGYPPRETHPIYAIVLDTYISFRITETSHKRKIEKKGSKSLYETYEYVPSGKLCFEIIDVPYVSHARNKWQDGKIQRVEDKMNDIIINMIKVATMKKEQEAQAARRHALWIIKEEKRREQERLKRIEKQRIQNLVKETEQMVKFNQLKEYFEVISQEGKQRLGSFYPNSDFSKWVEWAEKFLEAYSPTSWDLPKFDLPDNYRFY